MAAAGSLLKALRLMDDRSSQQTSQSGQPSKTSVELGINFKMVKDNNSKASPPTPTPSTDDESSSASTDGDTNPRDNNPEDDIIRKKLSMRAYHLPGNSWRQDLGMYIKNNHLIFGICCHHRLHPVTVKHRLVILLGSLAFGLTSTNAVYLYYLWGKGIDHYDDTALSISLGGEVVENVVTNSVTIDISHGMAILWTVGAAAHSFFDLAFWHMIACGCMKRKCCRIIGWNLAVAIVMLLIALTTFVVVVRAYESGGQEVFNGSGESDATFETELVFGNGHQADFQYLYGYGIELLLSLFVYTPLAQVLLFTGLLGCGTVPFLGGRPYEVRKWKRKNKNKSTARNANRIQEV